MQMQNIVTLSNVHNTSKYHTSFFTLFLISKKIYVQNSMYIIYI